MPEKKRPLPPMSWRRYAASPHETHDVMVRPGMTYGGPTFWCTKCHLSNEDAIELWISECTARYEFIDTEGYEIWATDLEDDADGVWKFNFEEDCVATCAENHPNVIYFFMKSEVL